MSTHLFPDSAEGGEKIGWGRSWVEVRQGNDLPITLGGNTDLTSAKVMHFIAN